MIVSVACPFFGMLDFLLRILGILFRFPLPLIHGSASVLGQVYLFWPIIHITGAVAAVLAIRFAKAAHAPTGFPVFALCWNAAMFLVLPLVSPLMYYFLTPPCSGECL